MKQIEQIRAKNKIKVFNLHFDSHFVSCSYEGEFRRHFRFLVGGSKWPQIHNMKRI